MKRTLMALVAGVMFVLVLSPSAQAAPTCASQVVTTGFSCSLGALTFNFELVSLGGGAMSINLETPTTGISGNDYTLDFQVTNMVPPGGDFHLIYEVTGPSIFGVDNSFGLSINPTGNSISEQVCSNDPTLGPCNQIGSLINTTGALMFSTPFTPRTAIWINKDVTDNGFSEFTDSVLSPEPATALLLGSALLGLGVLGRKKFRG